MKRWLYALCILAILIGAAWAIDAASGPYLLSWWTADGGGDTSTGGSYTLQGTLGQPDAGTMSQGQVVLTGGFWPGVDARETARLYLPLVLK